MSDADKVRKELEELLQPMVKGRAALDGLLREALDGGRADAIDRVTQARVDLVQALKSIREAYAALGVRPS